MATMHEEFTIEEQHFVVHFCGQKWFNAKYSQKEFVSVYGGKYLSSNAVHNWVDNSLKGVRKSQMMKRRCGSG
jgi:hypothetical protein